jgi:hypothetical protein
MSNKGIVMSIALFLVIVVGMFTFSYMKKQELQKAEDMKQNTPEPQVAYAEITRITAKHFFINGLHTFVGEIPFGTPCELLETSSTVAESMPEQVTLDFNVINNAEVCAQVVTTQRFKVEAQASEQAIIIARFMGREVELNLVPPSAGETPEDFELFIKG